MRCHFCARARASFICKPRSSNHLTSISSFRSGAIRMKLDRPLGPAVPSLQRRLELEGASRAGEVEQADQTECVGSLGGEGTLILSKVERRCPIARSRLHLDQPLHATFGERPNVVAGAGAVLLRNPTNIPREIVPANCVRRWRSKVRMRSSPRRPRSRLRASRSAGSNFATSAPARAGEAESPISGGASRKRACSSARCETTGAGTF